MEKLPGCQNFIRKGEDGTTYCTGLHIPHSELTHYSQTTLYFIFYKYNCMDLSHKTYTLQIIREIYAYYNTTLHSSIDKN